MPHAAPAARKERAHLSLEGLSIADAFGAEFSADPDLMTRRELPHAPWHYTDDTEMASSIVEILAEHETIDQHALAYRFARRYEANPRRGYGAMAHRILSAIYRGVDWYEASCSAFGGQGSMGNGSAMRVAPLGAYFADDLHEAAHQARMSAQVTHMHPEGQAGALAIAVAAAMAWQLRGRADPEARQEFLRTVEDYTPDGETRTGITGACQFPLDEAVGAAAGALGNGSQVTASDTIPFTLWCAARHLDNYSEALWATVSALGDMDTNCAIVGGIVALSAGEDSLPEQWRQAREPLQIESA